MTIYAEKKIKSINENGTVKITVKEFTDKITEVEVLDSRVKPFNIIPRVWYISSKEELECLVKGIELGLGLVL